MELSKHQIERYARHLILPEIGVFGQIKICSTSVLCIGAGGLGSPVILYLAAAGIGKIGIVDFDKVDLSNLHRQVLHSTFDIGMAKTESAREAIKKINPDVQVEVFNTKLTSQNALEIIEKFDIVVDGSDNFPTRYLVNDACVMLKKPNVYGSIFRFEGQASLFAPHLGGPCYRCLYPEPPPPGVVPSCAEAGVLGVLPGLIGIIQATEVIKLAAGVGTPLIGRLLLFNALDMKFKEIKVRKDPQCSLCGNSPSITKLIDYEMVCSKKEAKETSTDNITVEELKRLMDEKKQFRLIDVREPEEFKIAKIQGAELFPLSTFNLRFKELDPSEEYYIICKSGVRSQMVVEFLKQNGYKNVKNVSGGILAWSERIDNSVPKY
ncbi:MAG: molybdopterin-synthase adenylyltransferase MoeB [Verrucomicrobiia bacterium]